MTPASTTEPAVGASVCTSGSQVWKGTRGTLIANAAMKPKKSQYSVEVERPVRETVQDASTR